MSDRIHRTYSNPVIPGFHPDPSVCRAGDDYYLVNSSFEYFPGVPIHHSRDLVHWRLIGHCLTRQSQLDLSRSRSSGGIFAPTIRYHQGVFYMVTTTVDGGGNFYVTAADPAGPWSDPVWLDGEGIDPSFFFDDDGSVYYTRHVGRGDGYIGQTRIDIQTGMLEGELKEIWRGAGSVWPEGPHLYKHGRKYYLMIAEGGTSYDHRVTIASSDSPMGPFIACPNNPILTHRSDPKNPIQALGHADLVETDDGYWLAALGIRPQGGRYHHLGRETFLAPVAWTADGWPVAGKAGKIDLTMNAPRLKPVAWPADPVRDDFDQKQLGRQWNYLRNPKPGDYSLTARTGYLRLWGSALNMNSPFGSPAFVGRRQEHLVCRTSIKLSFDAKNENEEAGLVLRGNEKFHYDLALSRSRDERVVLLRFVGNRQIVHEDRFPAPGKEDVILSIAASPLEYKFSFTVAGETEKIVGAGLTRELAAEKVGGFTGVYIGFYATGNGRPCSVPADFDWFDYAGIEK